MTLTETAQFTKKALMILAIALVVIFSLWGGISYYLATRPKEVYVELPTKDFGILPKPPLPKTKLTSQNITYNLDTETGSLPTNFPSLIKVYFIPKLGTTFLVPDKAKKLAASFSFKNGPEIISPTLYKFTDNKGGEFIFDLETANFRFKRPIATNSAELNDSPTEALEAESALASNFKKFLAEHGVLTDLLGGGKTKVVYNKPRQLEASEATVTVWEADIRDGEGENPTIYPIVSPTFNEGLVKGVVTRYQLPDNKYLSLDYIYWPIDIKKFATYPIITVQQAYEKLQNGEGVTVLPYSQSNASIEKVYLAYLLPKDYTPYLQPVYVFEGPNFVSYVAAITSDNFEP